MYCLIFAQVMQSAQAASTDISDVPMALKNQIPPNIMLTLDDSGSMQWEFMPEQDMYFSIFLQPRPASPYGADTYANQLPNFDDDNVHNFFGRSSANNRIYYNPDFTYKPWSNSDGSLMANASPTAALYNPGLTSAGNTNLTAQTTKRADWFSDGGTGRLDRAFCDPGCGSNHTYWPITYFNYNGPNSAAARLVRTNYTKVEITTSTPSGATFTSPGGVTRTRAQEIQNFANWFQYYRSRVLTARAGIGRAFSSLGTTSRVGFGTINASSTTIDGVRSNGTVVLGVRQFTGAARTSFFTNFYGRVIPAEGTPLRNAADDIGQYFSRTDNNGPWGANPGAGGGTQYSCRQNYHILTTDGYWNDAAAATSGARANVDNTSGAVITRTDGTTFQYTPANPFRDSWSNTLADVAMYYWVRDLRTDLENNVPTNSADPAFWQHLTTFTVSIGLAGTIPVATIDAALGTTPPAITWPDPNASDPNKIDDLAHAAINGRGGFFVATDPDTLANSLTATVNAIAARTGSAAAVAVSNPNLSPGDNVAYTVSYNSGSWIGDLQAYPIDLTTGVPDISAPVWSGGSAQAQLDVRTSASRKIASYTGIAGTGQGIQFQPTTATTATKLSAAQQALLNSTTNPPGPSDGAAVVAYLRGDRSGETAGTYRPRAYLLGDIIHAEPLVIREPTASYSDTGYSAFKSANASRTKIVVQGANDGMLHAFNAATGAEEWAYVPNLLMANLNNLSRKNGYTHKYYVDGTPVSGDVDLNNSGGVVGTPDWRTIVVGGLGKGGRGYYALDVTQIPGPETDLAGKVLWEFPNSATNATVRANIGYSFGRPIIAKTRAQGWVVLVASGYNNGTSTGDSGGNGQGYLFVLNAKTGALIKAIGTGVGSATDPSGLAHISGRVASGTSNSTVEYVYGGDLKGNVWRFDLTHASNINQWSVTKLAALVDASGNAQPVTTEPELGTVRITGGAYKRFVYVGTGRYLGDSDIPGSSGANANASQTQTMYGLVDDLSTPGGTNPVINPLRASLQQQTFTVYADGSRIASANSLNFSTQKGWYLDLPTSGERLDTHPTLVFGALIFNTNVPSADPCVPGGSSFQNVLNYQNGGFLPDAFGGKSSIRSADTLSNRAVAVKIGDTVYALTRPYAAGEFKPPPEIPVPGLTGTKRKSWIELMQ
jgi:type IV pilus assembly protein PilY1